MNELFVPYIEALELKQLGFDEPCFGYYDEEGDDELYEYADCSGNVTGNKSCYNYDFLSVTNSQLNEYGAFSSKDDNDEEVYERWTAPLYTQAFKFFRDNFGLYQHIQRISENWYTPVLSASGKFRLGHIGQEFSNRYNFNTHEEAELECLRKLIQIVKKQIDEITE